jgi:NAD-dependent DNA ligase
MSPLTKIRRLRTVEPRVKQLMTEIVEDGSPDVAQNYPLTVSFKALEKFSEFYHSKNSPLVDDTVFDEFEEQMRDRKPNHAYFRKTGSRIGNKRAEVPLPIPMPSLQQLRTKGSALGKFFDVGGTYTVMDKLDGISLLVVYDKGVPAQAFTRGNGKLGQDVSHILPSLKIPKRISIKTRFAARAEAIIHVGTFAKKHDKNNTKGGKFSAARNMVGGVLNKLPTSKDYATYKRIARDIDVIFYEVMDGRSSDQPINKQLATLKRLGFNTVWNKVYKDDGLMEELSQLNNTRMKVAESAYEIDGIVVARNVPYRRTARLPKHAFKFKENSEASMKIVPVKEVQWNVSRYGKIKPTVIIDPLRLGGVTVTNFTGHNLFYIMNGWKKEDAKRNLPVRPIGPGAQIRVVRSGQVIPYIVEVVKPARKPAMPDMAYDVQGVEAYYSGTHDDQKIKRLTHFFVTLGMDGFKKSTFDKLYQAGYTTPTKIMKLTPAKLAKLDKFGDAKVSGLVSEVKRVTTKPDIVKFIVASGYLPGFGEERVQAIVDEYPTILRWGKRTPSFVQKKVEALRGFKELAGQFAKQLPKVFRLADKLGIKLTLPKREKPVGNKFADLRVTFTGVRDKDLQAEIQKQGGTVQSMRADTNLVLIKEEGYTSSKVDKAIEKGIGVMAVDDFREKYKL